MDFRATSPIRLNGSIIEDGDSFREPWRYVSGDDDTPLLAFSDTPRFRAPENATLTTYPKTGVRRHYGVTTYLVRGARWQEGPDGRMELSAEVIAGRSERWIELMGPAPRSRGERTDD